MTIEIARTLKTCTVDLTRFRQGDGEIRDDSRDGRCDLGGGGRRLQATALYKNMGV